MGYTHRWARPEQLPVATFAAWSADVAKVITASDIAIRGPQGTGVPITTATLVSFNGDAARPMVDKMVYQFLVQMGRTPEQAHQESMADDAFEPFHIAQVDASGYPVDEDSDGDEWYRGRGWYEASCKTNWRPYDEVVTAALALLDHHFPRHCAISSDGHAVQWQSGIQLAESVTGFHLYVPSYVHWWNNPIRIDRNAFIAWSMAVGKVIAATDIPIAGPDGIGQPEVTSNRIAFNGVGNDARAPFIFSWHEPLLPEGVAYDPLDYPLYCQTGQRPYDTVVTAALVLLSHYVPETTRAGTFESSGQEGDWQAGVELAQDANDLSLVIPSLK